MTDDTKQQEQSPIIKNIEKVEQKDGININLKEILRNQESLEHELQSLISQKYAMESELTGVREQLKDRKKVVVFKQEDSEQRTVTISSSSDSESESVSKSESVTKSKKSK